MKADETEIKQEDLKIDTDSERTHYSKEEIVDNGNLKDEFFIDGQFNIIT